MNELQLWFDYQDSIRVLYDEGTLDDSELDRRLTQERLDFNEAVDELFFAESGGESRHLNTSRRR